jgi:hypothetical protein
LSDARLLELKIQDRLRAAFLTVFQGTGDSGALVLSAIANQCGANAFDPEEIKPDLVAFWNWLLSMLGIRGDVNVNLTSAKGFQDYIQEMRAVVALANMNDVAQELAQLGGTDGS